MRPPAVVAQVIAGGPQLLFDQFVGQCLVDAAAHGRLEVMRLLLARPSGWVPSAVVAEYALELAMCGRHVPCVAELLQACPQINATCLSDAFRTELCIRSGEPADDEPVDDLEVAVVLLKDPRINVDGLIVEFVEDAYDRDEDGHTGEFLGGHCDELELVLAAGGVPSAAAADRALLSAAANCDEGCLKVLLKRCPQITAPARAAAVTAVIRSNTAAIHGDAEADKSNALLCLLQIGGAEPPVEALIEAAERDDVTTLKLFAPFVAKALRAGRGAGEAGAGEAGAGERP